MQNPDGINGLPINLDFNPLDNPIASTSNQQILLIGMLHIDLFQGIQIEPLEYQPTCKNDLLHG